MKDCAYYQELISRLLDGDLSAREEADLRRHLDGCSACAALYSAFAAVSRGIGSGLEEPPADLRENVMADIRREEIRRKNRLPAALRGVLSVAAVAVLVVGVYWGVSLSRSTQGAALNAAAYETAPLEEKALVPEEAAAFEEAAEAEEAPEAARFDMAAGADASMAAPAPTLAPAAKDEAGEPASQAAEALPDEDAAPAEDGRVWDLSSWDLSLLRELLGGEPAELNPEDQEPELLGSILVRSRDQLVSVPLYVQDGALYYLDPLDRSVYRAELSPGELLGFLGEDA